MCYVYKQMNFYYRSRSIILIFGDLAIFYLGLLITLVARYGYSGPEQWWILHLFPFSVLFAGWIFIFIVAGLYEPLSFSASPEIRAKIARAMLVAGIIGIALFYALPQPGITPKTNLIIDLSITTALLMLWRKLYGLIVASSDKIKVIFFGLPDETKNLMHFLETNPHLGYKPVYVLDNDLPKTIREKGADLVVASLDIRSDTGFIKTLYEVLPLGIAYLNFPQFYERITGKIPVSMISEMWFLENLTENEKRIFETGKRTFDILAGALLGVLTILILPFAALAIKLESKGPIFFRQYRVGKNGKTFGLIKFRSKIHDGGEKNSGWNKEEDEKRTTLIGKILRKTYIDELPQALNIIKGDMSLIGPRPERPEFVDKLKREVPHYMMRLLVRPGISGWAQISMKYDASAADAMEKLQHDLYYIKNRSLGLDTSIAFKTLFIMLSRSGK